MILPLKYTLFLYSGYAERYITDESGIYMIQIRYISGNVLYIKYNIYNISGIYPFFRYNIKKIKNKSKNRVKKIDERTKIL